VTAHFHLFTYGTLSRPSAGDGDQGREAGGRGSHGGSGGGRGSVGASPVEAGSGADLLTGCERVAEAVVAGTLYDMGAYPTLLLGGPGAVHGQVWRCPATVLPELDRYEGVDDGLFRRVGLRVGDLPCWVYVAGPRLGARLRPEARIVSGRWQG
jgi:gamma-glutamylcyclotransferase (GGCT)/AIG2-like uncharacterized protein YtfP